MFPYCVRTLCTRVQYIIYCIHVLFRRIHVLDIKSNVVGWSVIGYITATRLIRSFRDKPRPYHDCAVLGAASDDEVIMRTPVDVQHWARVTTYCRVGLVYASRLWDRRQRCYKECELLCQRDMKMTNRVNLTILWVLHSVLCMTSRQLLTLQWPRHCNFITHLSS